MASVATRLIIGFIAGALAVVTFHQLAILALGGRAWSVAPVPPFGVPLVIDLAFWGGVWGVVYAALEPYVLTRQPLLLRGLAFGLVGPTLFGWLILPLIKGGQFFAGFAAQRMLAGAFVNGLVFGCALAVFYLLLQRALASAQSPQRTIGSR